MSCRCCFFGAKQNKKKWDKSYLDQKRDVHYHFGKKVHTDFGILRHDFCIFCILIHNNIYFLTIWKPFNILAFISDLTSTAQNLHREKKIFK